MPDYPFRPSATYLFLCAGAYAATKAFTAPETQWARTGTEIHAAIATAAVAGVSDVATAAPASLRADAEALNTAQRALDELNAIIETCTEWSVEQPLDIGEALGPDYKGLVGGTADFVGYNAATRIAHLADPKTGDAPVMPTSPQMRAYAVAVAAKYPELDKIILSIIQPTTEHVTGGVVNSVELSRAEIDEQRRWLRERIDAALEPDASRTPGTWCKHCPALALCRPAAEFAFGYAARVQAADVPAEDLEDPVIARIVTMGEVVAAFVRSVQNHATEKLKSGSPIAGLKLTRARAHRSIPVDRSGEAIAELAANGADLDKLAPRRIATPAALERAGFKEIANRFATASAGPFKAVPRDALAKEVPPPAVRGFDGAGAPRPEDFEDI